MTELSKIALESLAVGSASMTLARSRMFREVRWWFARERPHYPHEWVWDFVKCPWCVSHWVAAGVVAAGRRPVAATSVAWLDYAINWLVIVALAPVAAFLVHRCYGALPQVPTEAEWNAVDEIEREDA
jgi:hypothetical protein